VSLRRASGPRYRRDLSRSLNDLGVVLNALSRYDSAEIALAEALDIRRAEFGDRHRSTGITANNLAAAYYLQSKIDEAIAVQQVALDAIQAELGPEHQRSIVALSNLAAFKRAKGDWSATAADYRDLVERQARLQGPDHPVTARVMLLLGSALVELATGRPSDPRLQEADTLFRRAIAAFERTLGPDHPQVGIAIEVLRSGLNEQNRLDEALGAAERAVRILRSTLGEANHYTAQAVAGLAVAHWRLGHLDEALRLRRESLAGHEQTVGLKHPDTARERSLLCFQLLELRQAAEARQWCERALESLRASRSPSAHQEAVYMLWLAHAYAMAGRRDTVPALLSAVRARIDSGAGGSQAKRLLDSLTATSGAPSRDRSR